MNNVTDWSFNSNVCDCWKGNKGKKSARYFAMNCVRAHLPAPCIENLLEEKEKKSLDSRTKNQVVSWQSSPEVYPKEEKGQMYSSYYLTLPIKSCKDDGSVLNVFSTTAKSKFLRETIHIHDMWHQLFLEVRNLHLMPSGTHHRHVQDATFLTAYQQKDKKKSH